MLLAPRCTTQQQNSDFSCGLSGTIIKKKREKLALIKGNIDYVDPLMRKRRTTTEGPERVVLVRGGSCLAA